MRINEIFSSIQGEGLYAGEPTVFVRLQGCNLKCKWCDTSYAQNPAGGEEMSVQEVFAAINQMANGYPWQWVCITGGEPLLQKKELLELVKLLKKARFFVEVETNGSIKLSMELMDKVSSWVVDYKLPSSGEHTHYAIPWQQLRIADQLKFVVSDADDLRVVTSFRTGMEDYRHGIPTLLVSPALKSSWFTEDSVYIPEAGALWVQNVAQYCVKHGMRFSLQIHKYIWGNRKGV